MKLIFGLHLDDLVVPSPTHHTGGVAYCGPQSLLHILETHLGLAGAPDNIDFLRVEQYRQALIRHEAQTRQVATSGAQPSLFGEMQPTQSASDAASAPFYAKSFAADPFATAAELLSRRDELLLAGWDFSLQPNTPSRLQTLAEIEALFRQKSATEEEEELALTPGFAERFCQVLEKLQQRGQPFREIYLNEPFTLLPSHFQRLFKAIANLANGVSYKQLTQSQTPIGKTTDLAKFQALLSGEKRKEKWDLAADGTLILIRAKRANEAADYLSRLLRLNPGFRPACLIPDKNRTLEMALVKEGLPSLGILSASLARPALQILKLAPTFVWKPIDPFKILEFVSLAVKPLPDELATQIANQIARTPGLQGEGWYAMTNRYFAELEEKESPAVVAQQRKQFRFWFERPRHSIHKVVPKAEVLEIFDYLHEWALLTFEENGSKNQSLLVLREQAKRIAELLQALPEQELGYLQLERIVRTIYEPSPVTFQERELGSLAYTMHPGAFIEQVEEVLWWDFVQNDPPHFFSRWYPNERTFLEKRQVLPEKPAQENARLLWQNRRPVLMAKNRLLLVIPDVVDGVETISHPLLGDLEAAFGNLEKVMVNISDAASPLLSQHFTLPTWETAQRQDHLGRPKAFLQISNINKLGREYETLTSLESLFYYPYQWFFRHKIKLQKSAILSVVKDHTLMGNLAHRVFEKLLQNEDIYRFSQEALESWVDQFCRQLLEREGAVLLMYGREPERIAFINKLKYAAWNLVSHIRDNDWQVLHTEKELTGLFPGQHMTPAPDNQVPVKGIADLILARGDERAIVDFKWRGTTYRANVLKNLEDLQLVLYARLLNPEGAWAHTAYFIISDGKMVARNNLAFKRTFSLSQENNFAEINENILKAMEATWHWRMQQLAKGEIEIRTRQTLSAIEDKYGDDDQEHSMMDILEMKGEDAKWDDYRTLINLIQ